MKLKTKLRIERLWSVMGGLLFSLLPCVETDKDNYFFDIGRWFTFDRWNGFGRSDFWDEFIFGFIFTFILVKSIRRYKETN